MNNEKEIIIGENGKICKVCNEIKLYKDFRKSKMIKDGFENKCKACRKVEYQSEIKDKKRQYYIDNKEYIKSRISKYDKEYQKRNKDKIKEYKKEYMIDYRENNRGYLNEQSKIRHQQRILAEGEFTEEEFENISLDFFSWKCAYTGEVILEEKSNCHREHVIPISKGGVNYIWNIIPSTPFANISKKDRELEVWYREQPYFSEERLQKIYDYIEVVKASMDGEK